MQCRISSYCPAASLAETPCPPGYYCPSPSSREPCRLGSDCHAEGGTAEHDCPVGYHCPTPDKLVACAPGKFSATPRATQCSKCSAGWYAAGGSTVCTYCYGEVDDTQSMCTPADRTMMYVVLGLTVAIIVLIMCLLAVFTPFWQIVCGRAQQEWRKGTGADAKAGARKGSSKNSTLASEKERSHHGQKLI